MKELAAPVFPPELAPYWDETMQRAHAEWAGRSLAAVGAAMPPLQRVNDDRAAAYTELPAAADVSPREAIVLPLPYTNGWDEAMAIRMGLLRSALPNAPRMIVFPNNTGQFSRAYHLSGAERQAVASGNFAPIVEGQLRTLDALGVRRAQYLGYSQGAAVSAAALRVLSRPEREYIEVGPSGMFAPPNAVSRYLRNVARHFVVGGGDFNQTVNEAAIPALSETLCTRKGDAANQALLFVRYGRSMLLDCNVRLASGFCHPTFVSDMAAALAAHTSVRFTVGAGARDRMMPPEAIAALKGLATRHANLSVLTMEGYGHGLAGNVVAHALLGRAALLAGEAAANEGQAA